METIDESINIDPTNITNWNHTGYYDYSEMHLINISGYALPTNRTGHFSPTALDGSLSELPNYVALFLLLIPCITIFGNVLVIISVRRERTLRTATNYLIVSMASADVLVAFCVMPFAVYVEVENGVWRLPRSLCTVYTALDVCASTASILNLVAISWDRYMAVSKPIEYSRSHSKNRRVLIAILLVWFFSFLIALPVMTGFNRLDDTPYCEFTNAAFIIASSFASFYLPCLVMVGLYSVVLQKLRKRQSQIRSGRTRSLLYSKSSTTYGRTGGGGAGGGAGGGGGKSSATNKATTANTSLTIGTCGGEQSLTLAVASRSALNSTSVTMERQSIDNLSKSIDSFPVETKPPLADYRSGSSTNHHQSQSSPKSDRSISITSDDEGVEAAVEELLEGESMEFHSSNFTLSLDNSSNGRLSIDDESRLSIPRNHVILLDGESLPFIDHASSIDGDRTSGSRSIADYRSEPLRSISMDYRHNRISPQETPNRSSPIDPSKLSSVDHPTTPSITVRRPSAPAYAHHHLQNGGGVLRALITSTSLITSSTAATNPILLSPNHRRSMMTPSIGGTSSMTTGSSLPEITKFTAITTPSSDRTTIAKSLTSESRSMDRLDRRVVVHNGLILVDTSERKESNGSYGGGALAVRFREMAASKRQALLLRRSRRRAAIKAAAASKYSKQCRKERKATYMLAVVLVVFLACWLPFFACHMTNSICIIRTGETCINIAAFFMTTWLGYMNSFMNPVIYTIFNPEYRRAFKNILCCRRANRGRIIR